MTGLPAAFPVRVHMLSDWIVGTGEGRVGDVDATVRRDAGGLPFVPAKTLTGVWRDACEQVAGWLDGGDGTSWQAWVDWIFGSQPDRPSDLTATAHRGPAPAALALSPARLPAAVRGACRDRPALQAAAVFLRPGVAIDDQTGVARDDMLRLEERARPAVLEALAEFKIHDPAAPEPAGLPRPAELLLRAGAAAVDSLGGKRNRGAGRCWLLLPGITGPVGPAVLTPVPATPRPPDDRLAELASDLDFLDSPGPPPRRTEKMPRLVLPAAEGTRADAHPKPARQTLRITFEVITPVIAQARVLGNVVLGRDSIPGSLLLAVILARLDGKVGHRELVVGDARPAILDGDTPVPGLPAPMVWHRPKERHRHDVVNAAQRRPDPADRRKAMRSGHVAPAGAGSWQLLTPAMAVSTHAVIDDDKGRPTEDPGGVFSNLALAPGTLLISDLVLPADRRLNLRPGERLRLGRSRKDDFGQVEVREIRTVPAPDLPQAEAGTQLRVWCVSDVLLRDQWGAPDPRPQALADALAHRLGVPVEVVAAEPGGPVVQAYRSARRESFHTRWGRPRPSLVGLAAGSVITLRLGAAVPGDALAAAQRDGIGERTAEGFGQLRFNAAEVTVDEPQLAPATHGADRADVRPTPAAAASPARPGPSGTSRSQSRGRPPGSRPHRG